MRYLLDVNALVALGLLQHEFHQQVARWVRSLASGGVPELATCSITELGFVRVWPRRRSTDSIFLRRAPLLLHMKTSNALNFTLIADNQGVAHLSAWVKTAKQTTDGHLAQLATANGAVLATLDTKIRRAFVIRTGK